MSLEERKRKLAEARAAREAKDRQVEQLGKELTIMREAGATAAAAATPADATPTKAPAASSPTRAVAASPQQGSGGGGPVSIQRSLALVDVQPSAPPRPDTYAKAVDTDPVFVYSEARPHPDGVVPKEELEAAKRNALDATGAGEGREAQLGMTLGMTMGGAVLWDRGLDSRHLRNRALLDFVDAAVSAVGGALRSDPSAVPASLFLATPGQPKTSKMLTRRASFLRERGGAAAHHAIIVGLAFQPGSTETFAVAYGSGDQPASSLEPRSQDVVCVWNTRRGVPSPLQFHHEITAIACSPFHPHLLLGGSARGHIVAWDTRSGPQPVATSFASLAGHNSPIVMLRVVGDASRSALVSVSSDGRVCTWSVEALRHPLSTATTGSGIERIAPTAAAVPRGTAADVDTSRIFLASSGGMLFSGSRSSTASNLEATPVGPSGHDGVITAVDCHPHHADPAVSGLVLTAGTDWACRVWLSGSSVRISLPDAVYDARWCPTRPGLFAAADASGSVTLWNLAVSTQCPVARLQLEDSTTLGGRGPVAIRRLEWDTSGEHIIAGANQGEVFVLGVRHDDAPQGDEALAAWVYSCFGDAHAS